MSVLGDPAGQSGGSGRVSGKVALVTGSARGQGAAHARLLAEEGAAVLLTDVLDEEGQAVAEEIAAAGGRASYQRLDVASPADWDRATATIRERFGPVTVLVANAGVVSRRSLLEVDDEEWERVTAINQRGVMLGMRHCIPSMVEAGGGSVINISSVLGIAALAPHAAYMAAKHAVIGMTRAAARSYGPDGVRVNAVCPGMIATPMSGGAPAGLVTAMVERIPLGRAAEPVEVAQLVLFLASEEASYVSGTAIPIDGALMA